MLETTQESQAIAKQRISQLPDKLTLPVILDLFEQMDQGLIDLSVEDMTELGEKMHDKIDGYKAIIDRCDTEIAHFERLEKEFALMKSSVKNTKEKILKMLKFFMEQKGCEVLTGNIWRVNLKRLLKNKTVSINNTPANSTLYMQLGEMFIKRSYAWNIAEIKKNLKSKMPDKTLEKLFKLGDTIKPEFTPKSEVKK